MMFIPNLKNWREQNIPFKIQKRQCHTRFMNGKRYNKVIRQLQRLNRMNLNKKSLNFKVINLISIKKLEICKKNLKKEEMKLLELSMTKKLFLKTMIHYIKKFKN